MLSSYECTHLYVHVFAHLSCACIHPTHLSLVSAMGSAMHCGATGEDEHSGIGAA